MLPLPPGARVSPYLAPGMDPLATFAYDNYNREQPTGYRNDWDPGNAMPDYGIQATIGGSTTTADDLMWWGKLAGTPSDAFLLGMERNNPGVVAQHGYQLPGQPQAPAPQQMMAAPPAPAPQEQAADPMGQFFAAIAASAPQKRKRQAFVAA